MAKPTVPRGLGPRTPLRIAAPRLLEARLGDVRKYEQALLRGLPAEPIHDMRVASRRLRIAVKKLRYCAELAGPALPKQSKKLLGQLVPLQEMLGDLHDMDVRIALLGVMRASGLRRSERARRARLAQQLLRELQRWQKKNLVHHLRREWD